MATETILVPGQGIARWLELRIADQLGIAAGMEMPFLSAYLHRLSAVDDTGSNDRFSREVLVLRLWRLISERLNSQDPKVAFGAATDYCKRDEDGRKRLQLCMRLAACFDDYQLYRDDLLTDFSKGDDHKALSPHAPWQARIWRALLEDAGLTLPTARTSKRKAVEATPFLFAEMADEAAQNGPSSETAHRMVSLRARLNNADWCRANLPPRLSLFGATTMPPALLDVLHHIAQHIPVFLYVPQPTPHYVGDLRERKNRAGDNALLARFGTESREFQSLLVDLEERAETGPAVERLDLDELEESAPPDTLLGCLQYDIVHAFDRGERGADRHQLSLDDTSLRVHDCHSAQRELEVVRDQIFAALEDDASLQARDILVLVPDIDRYAPYAHAVFGPVHYNLPFHVADRHPARELPICRSLLAVLELASTRLTLADVLHLLENTAVQRRFGLFPNDVPVLRHLCQEAGIRWGLDGESRHEQFELPAFDDNSWRQGIDRLLLGTLTGPTNNLVLGKLPVGDTTETRAELLAKFVTFSRTLFAQVAVLRHPHAFEDWADRVDAVAEALFTASDGDEEDAIRQLKLATNSLRSSARTAEHTEPVTLSVLRDWLHDTLAQGAQARGFLGGSITIAAMLPMRAVPVRCLFICGLNDDSFPRRDKPAPFNLMVAKPRPGDRNRRLDDRQLFLDLLLAARDRLHLTFVGRSAKDNAEGAPSVVLAELFDHVDRTCVSSKLPDGNQLLPHKQIVVQHPLQPWSERYRDGSDQRLFTYARDSAVQPAHGLRDEQQPWCPEGLDIEPVASRNNDTSKLALEDLLTFWWHPCSAFLRETMRVRVRSDDEQEESDEPFSLDALTRYQLQDEAVRHAQRGDDDHDDPLQYTRAKGVLPVGSHGDAAYQALRAETYQLLQEARNYAATTSRRIDLTFGKTRITGTIDGFSDRDLVYMRVSKIKAKDRLRAWLLHLVVTMQRLQDGEDHKPAWPQTTRVLASDGTWFYSEVPESIAREQLELLLSLYSAGKRRPLPFFERCSYAVCEKLNKHNDEVKAMRQGTKDYAVKDTSDPWKYDEGDAAIALCMRNRDPFEGGIDSEFFRLAKAVWSTPIGFLKEQN